MEERESSAEDKTEEATEERRKQFREEGNVASPRELVAAVSLACFALLLPSAGKALHASIGLTFTRTFSAVTRKDLTPSTIVDVILGIAAPVLPWLAGLLVVVMAIPVAVGLMLTRFNWTWKALSFKLEKLNPVTGVMRMFSGQALMELIKSFLKFVVLSACIYAAIKQDIAGSELLHFMDVRTVMGEMGESVMRLLFSVALASFVLGVVDFGYNWWNIERKMRMTKQEIKEETKSQEGDPHVKGQRRRMARDLVLRKNLNNVPQATFIVTNPEHFSVAIRYVRGMAAPVVVAKGQDFLALRIREIAKKNDIMIVENKPLARTLYKTVKVGQEVPPSLYASVIEVMKYIYQIRGRDYFSRFDLQGAMV